MVVAVVVHLIVAVVVVHLVVAVVVHLVVAVVVVHFVAVVAHSVVVPVVAVRTRPYSAPGGATVSLPML